MRSISVIMFYSHAENQLKKVDHIEILTGIIYLSMKTYPPLCNTLWPYFFELALYYVCFHRQTKIMENGKLGDVICRFDTILKRKNTAINSAWDILLPSPILCHTWSKFIKKPKWLYTKIHIRPGSSWVVKRVKENCKTTLI